MIEALRSGHIRHAGLDVFSSAAHWPWMRSVPRRIRVPGASPAMAAFWTSRDSEVSLRLLALIPGPVVPLIPAHLSPYPSLQAQQGARNG
jgi:hypothetical protein